MSTTIGSDARDIVRAGLAALDAAGVPYCVRGFTAELVPPDGADLDVLVPPASRQAAAEVLAAAGWHPLRAPGHWGHQFWLRTTETGHWLKIDLVWRLRYGSETESTSDWVSRRRELDGLYAAAQADEDRHRERRARGQRETPGPLERAARRLPPRFPRSGPVVVVLGPDGAGKSSAVARLASRIPVATTTGYLGIRQRPGGASDPLTGQAVVAVAQQPPPAQRVRLRELAFLGRKWLRTVPTVATVYAAAWRGHVVLLDRHPIDAVAVRPRRTLWGARFERLLVTRLTPAPDALIVLDAPGAVLFARKGEHSPEALDAWRVGYRRLPGAVLVDATRSPEEVVDEVSRHVWRQLAVRRGWTGIDL